MEGRDEPALFQREINRWPGSGEGKGEESSDMKEIEVCKEELMETEGGGPNQSTGNEKRGE